ncbi:UPF0481 protein At3g47200-like [Dioscorea cayenensis subsp. rotundata]|uniref:UPF0481 protein At3g47200-like n=1 Tax=Dioscorea cayennensis subsp. rotundata TaxID=55577 RepID=A0AB40CN12_DIOCR|nr:UPF0481 protein At3g47200-like [Dioscorea cayenensis subsp. rotundata]
MQSSLLSQERATEGTQNDHQSISVELLQERRAEEVIVDVQDSHQLISVTSKDDQWIGRVTERLRECKEKTRSSWSWSIFKVRTDIRKCDMNAYDPIIVAISPYHHNKYKERTTLQAMQDHKWHCVWRLLSRCTNGEHDKANYLLSTCLMAMMSKNTDVRGSYSKNLQDLEDEDLALIMLLDGCFIIHVENQIPFFIIQELFDKLKTSEDENIDLVKIVDKLLRRLTPSRSKNYTTIPPEQSGSKSSTITPPDHLLDWFHSTLVPSKECVDINQENLKKQNMDFEIEWIPNVTELQFSGVKFKEKKKKKGCLMSFLDVSCKDGTIEIPKVKLNGATISLFRNLIAYEQCDYLFTNTYVTAYASFMDYMINSPKDVALFELNGIFINQLGTPDPAATLINTLMCDHTQDGGDNYISSRFNACS